MERILALLLVLIATLCIIYHVQAQSPEPEGFISLDCGLHQTAAPYYTEEITQLKFTSDIKYIQETGSTCRTHTDQASEFLKPYTTMRFFPKGERNCYNLPVEKGRNHLIRAWFVYGNYDEKNSGPKFDLYFGPNLWASIDLERDVNGTVVEVFHIPTSKLLQICLVKTGESVPLISALELRPMPMGDPYTTEYGSLNLHFRRYFSKSSSVKDIRYPDDVFDRRWTPDFMTEWTSISTTSDVANTNDYDPPTAALATAAIPTNASVPLTIKWDNTGNPNEKYYLYAHFLETQDLGDNETREFDIEWNGEIVSEPIIPPKLELTTTLITSPTTCKGTQCIFQLIRTNSSTLPPLLNALEVFKVQFLQSETDENDVAAIRNIEASYGLDRINWQGDPCVPEQLRWDGLNCSNTNMSITPRITNLNLSSSGLSGNIAAAIQNLTQLVKLDLSNNNLTGEVPEFLGKMKSLLIIDLRENDLTGSVPRSLQREGLALYLQENPRLGPSEKRKSILVPMVATVVSAAIILGLLVLYLVLRKKNTKVVHPPPNKANTNVTYANSSKPSIETKKRRFTYSEVMEMTNNFQRVIGKGGFGVVYHGIVNGSEQVAVKLLSQSSVQGYKEFKAEVDLLLRVHHTHLVSLFGYCDERDHLALIYEFVPNGDLRQHLLGKGGKSIVSWDIRLQIAVEAAQGLEYLHIGCTPPMIHRDVKTTNILLDEHYKAKLADFGLSRSFPTGGESHISTVIAGTPGYLDPEYYLTSRLSEKSDVYSFGIVLLEIITNEPVIDQNRRNPCITQWVGYELNGGDITKIMDPNLNGDYDSQSVWRALELAMSCANPTSAKRPSMSHAVSELKECLVSENSRRGMSQSSNSMSSREAIVVLESGMIPKAR